MHSEVRVLAPEGTAFLGSEVLVKPRPATMDDWPQQLHDASGNSVSKDKALKPVTLQLIRRGVNDWTAKEPADYKLDSAKVEEFLSQRLYLIYADKFVTHKGTPTPDQKLDTQAGALSIEITLDGEKEPYTLIVGALEKDGRTYFATSNKAPGAIFLLFKEKFEKVRSGPDYFQKK